MNPTAELTIRFAAFAGVLAAMALWELVAPRRSWVVGRAARWPSNLGIVAVDAVTLRLLIPTAPVGAALIAEARGFGLFHWLGWPTLVAGLIGFVVLDLVIYGQHVAFHHVPWLWRLHRVHHADLDVDVTTGVRFHPIEILLSMVVKIAAVALFGIPAAAVVAFEVVLNATAMFNHANVALPAAVDRLARLIVVTPDMHRVHHSVVRSETDSNFGFNLPWWDRLFGTYRAAPAAGHKDMSIGLPVFRDGRELRLDRLLTQPFRAPADPNDAAPMRAGEVRRS
ncbi:MAG TPA: sterol desaturase family protein [Xanthobacteraceae bacterium]|nr:sterol desaturase family protein [Xanthobacteraceae bacterium]